jgi:hypothetical protein
MSSSGNAGKFMIRYLNLERATYAVGIYQSLMPMLFLAGGLWPMPLCNGLGIIQGDGVVLIFPYGNQGRSSSALVRLFAWNLNQCLYKRLFSSEIYYRAFPEEKLY